MPSPDSTTSSETQSAPNGWAGSELNAKIEDEALRIAKLGQGWPIDIARDLAINNILMKLTQAQNQAEQDAKPKVFSENRFEWIDASSNAKPVLNGNWLVKKVLPAEGIGVIYGRPGGGKTFTVMDIALHLAAGLPWRGCKVSQSAVSYITPEAGRMGVNRVIGWALHHGMEWPSYFRLSPVNIDLRSNNDDADALIASIKSTQPNCRLVVIDTLNRAMAGGDENSSGDMGRFVMICDRIAKATGAFVLVVHHSGKDATKGSRGHSSLLGATWSEYEVAREEGETSGTIKVTKMRDGPDGDEYGFKMGSIHLGYDDDGEEVTTGISLPADAADAKLVKAAAPTGKNQKVVAEAFDQFSLDHGKPTPFGTGFPEPGLRAAVAVDAFIDFAIGKITSGAAASDRRKTVREALDGLISKHYFCVNQGLIWKI